MQLQTSEVEWERCVRAVKGSNGSPDLHGFEVLLLCLCVALECCACVLVCNNSSGITHGLKRRA